MKEQQTSTVRFFLRLAGIVTVLAGVFFSVSLLHPPLRDGLWGVRVHVIPLRPAPDIFQEMDRRLVTALQTRAPGGLRGDRGQCVPCRALHRGQVFFYRQAERTQRRMQFLEMQQGHNAEGHTALRRSVAVQREKARQMAQRSLLGLGHFAGADERCRAEFCTGDRALHETEPLWCQREERGLRLALARLKALADALASGMRPCLDRACSVMDCRQGGSLIRQMHLAEKALSMLTTGPDPHFPNFDSPNPEAGRPVPVPAETLDTFAAALETVYRRLGREALSPALARSLGESLGELHTQSRTWSGFGSGTGSEAGSGTRDWDTHALRMSLEKIRRDLEALAAGQEPVRQSGSAGGRVIPLDDILKTLSRTLLQVSRLYGASLAGPAGSGARSQVKATCGLSHSGEVHDAVRTALSALKQCYTRSECYSGQEKSVFPDDPQTEALVRTEAPEGVESPWVFSSRAQAFQALTEGLMPGPERALQVRTRPAPRPSLSVQKSLVKTGEVIQVTLKATPGMCLVPGGLISLTDKRKKNILSYRLEQLPTEPLLFSAPSGGAYILEVFSSSPYGTMLLESLPVEVEPLELRCRGFTGRWRTDVGLLTLVERQGRVTGSYRRSSSVQPGFVVGRVENGELRGVWTTEIARGNLRLRLNPDRSFSGKWEFEGGGSGEWTGECLWP